MNEDEIGKLLEKRALVEAATVIGGRSANYCLDKASLWVAEYLTQKDKYLKRTLNRLEQALEVQTQANTMSQPVESKKAGRPKKKAESVTQ